MVDVIPKRVVQPVVGIKPDMCAEYRPVWLAQTTRATGLDKYAQNWMVKEFAKTRNFWDRFDIAHLLGNHTNDDGEALLNLKLPGTFDATNFNNPIHTPKQGLQYNGADNYTMHNWIASVNGVNYMQNSASMILYIRTNISKDGTAHGIQLSADNKNMFILSRAVANNAWIQTNDNTYLSGANADGSGLYVNTRTGAAVKLYRNGVAIINGTTASTGVPTHKPYTGCYNDDDVATGFQADEVLFVGYMDGCTQEDVTELTRIINGYATLLGTNVF